MYPTTQAKTKLASLALAAFITIVVNGSLIWQFDQVASEPTHAASFKLAAGSGSFEI
jgi:hypothetical protein